MPEHRHRGGEFGLLHRIPACRVDPSKDLGLPRQLVLVKLGRLQDHITGDPGRALPAA